MRMYINMINYEHYTMYPTKFYFLMHKTLLVGMVSLINQCIVHNLKLLQIKFSPRLHFISHPCVGSIYVSNAQTYPVFGRVCSITCGRHKSSRRDQGSIKRQVKVTRLILSKYDI